MNKSLFFIAICSIIMLSCKDEMSDSESGGQYLYGFWTFDWGNGYIWQSNTIDQWMTGTISVEGVGIETWGNYVPVANTFFACNNTDEGAVSYDLDGAGNIREKGRLFIESNYALGVSEDNKGLIVGASWEASSLDNEIMIYDPESVSITNRRFSSFYYMQHKGDSISMFPTGVQTCGDKLFVPVFPRTKDWGKDGLFLVDTAYMMVFNYPSLEYVKTVKDARTGPIGIYYCNIGSVQTESGDIYTFSSNSYAGGYSTHGTKPSGILRIRKGASDFDPDYFFDIENSELHGKVLSAYPAGGEKVVVNYIPTELDTEDMYWAFLNNGNTYHILKSAILDLSQKTITPVTGLPDHGGDHYYGLGSMYVEDGKAYKNFITATESRIYQIDVTTGEAKAGALVKGGFLTTLTRLNR